MAKIKYATFTTGIAGRSANIVFYQSPTNSFGYMRNYVYPRISTQNTEMGLIMKNLAVLWEAAADAYKEDVKKYALKYAKLPRHSKELIARTSNPFSVFVLLMFRFAEEHPESIGLDTLTMSDIVSLFLSDIGSVDISCNNGYLPKVEGYETLQNKIG